MRDRAGGEWARTEMYLADRRIPPECSNGSVVELGPSGVRPVVAARLAR